MIKRRYIIAVSGGVDSVVLLDMAAKWQDVELVIAHFDHGIRENSMHDAEFVMELAKKYRLPFEMQRAQLGSHASEDAARQARYEFLRRVAKKYDAHIVTAHHKDDVLETIIINLLRGTGWRGLCSLRSDEIYRPLLEMDKKAIIDYAQEHGLAWREDSTNTDEKYLRNYVRHRLLPQFDNAHRAQLFALYKEQCALYGEIVAESAALLRAYHDENGYRRHIFIMADQIAAKALLFAAIYAETGKTTMRPQLEQAIRAVKTFRPHTSYQIGEGVELRFSRTHMIVEAPRN